MKKAKFMLTAILILASVGGILAFKVMKYGTSKYCFRITEQEPPIGQCTNTKINSAARALFVTEPTAYYTTTNDVTKCNQAWCPNIGIPDQQ